MREQRHTDAMNSYPGGKHRSDTGSRACSASFRTRPASVMMAVTLAMVALLSGCSDRTPPLGRGLPKTFGPAPYFDTRIKERFPIGSDAAKLASELHNERFKVKGAGIPGQFSARYEFLDMDMACRESWTVHWTAEQGKIAAIGGTYEQACL